MLFEPQSIGTVTLLLDTMLGDSMDNHPLDNDQFAEQPQSSHSTTPLDKLFTPHDDWWNNACLNVSRNDWGVYALGYKEAADLLVEHVVNHRASQDTLVYPILFSYRHYIELVIKDTLRMAIRLQDVADQPMGNHNIENLWGELHKLLLVIFPDEMVNELKDVFRLVGEFYKVDARSFSFRYPVDKAGNPSLPGITHINLRNVRDVVNNIATILTGVNAQLYDYLQLKIEQEREFLEDCY